MKLVRLAMLASVAALAAAAPSQAALVTFSGLHNGINTATDPENFNTGQPIPANYQPLLHAYPAPNSNTDGANIGVTITWNQASIAAQPFGGVFDHTADVSTDNAEVLGYIDSADFLVTFSQPVLIPSFFFANFNGGGPYGIRFQGFTNPGDATPAYDSGPLTYNQASSHPGGGYDWIQETGLAGTLVQQIRFSGDNYKQFDDFTIVVPEPASLSLVGLGGLALLRRRRA
jgi:hypothetical protein